MTYDPDPLYVPEPDSDEAHYEAAAVYFERIDEEPEDRRGFLALVFMAVLVILAILAAALLIAAPRSGQEATTSVTPTPAQTGVPQPAVAHGKSTAVLASGDGSEVAGSSPASLGGTLPDTSTAVTGQASWYCGGGSACTRGYPEGTLAAAAGPALRVGDWRGRIVKVCGNGNCVKVALVDWCQCDGGKKVIDLYRSAFSMLASPSRGVVRVSITWGGVTLAVPPTDTK